jgi:hypothetical protein
MLDIDRFFLTLFTPNILILYGPDSDKISCGIHFFKVLVQIHYPPWPKADTPNQYNRMRLGVY